METWSFLLKTFIYKVRSRQDAQDKRLRTCTGPIMRDWSSLQTPVDIFLLTAIHLPESFRPLSWLL